MEELTEPFKDPRKTHREIGEIELFRLMTKENQVEIGNIVLAKSIKVGRSSVFCKLENDLEAVLFKKDIFDEFVPGDDLEEKMNKLYPKNSLFYGRVKNINKLNFKVEIMTKPSKLVSHKGEVQLTSLDDYFKIDEQQDFVNMLYTNSQETKENKKMYTKRNINHANYKNFNYIQCLEFLKNKEIGDYIFRPSSKSNNIITLSWKFYDNIISHITIFEEEKAKGANIGSKLRISNDNYSSLHEIVDRFISPCKRLLLDAISNRKFFYYDSVDAVEMRLKEEKAKDPVLIHYIYTINPAYPQFIILAYIPKQNQIIKEFMKVKPRGFFFHNNYFTDLNDVARYFKENYSKDEYRSYVRKVKPPGEEIINEASTNNYGSHCGSNLLLGAGSMLNINNISSGYGNNRNNNDYSSQTYLGNKRVKSPNVYSQMMGGSSMSNTNMGGNFGSVNGDYPGKIFIY